MTDGASSLLLVEVVFAAVFAFLGFDAIVNRRSVAPLIAPMEPRPFEWRWCPAGCSKCLTNDPLMPCPVCNRALEVR